jgi:hypothetical protein
VSHTECLKWSRLYQALGLEWEPSGLVITSQRICLALHLAAQLLPGFRHAAPKEAGEVFKHALRVIDGMCDEMSSVPIDEPPVVAGS